MKGCNKDLLTVVLAHEPQYLDKYSNAGVDLVLTGHAHGVKCFCRLLDRSLHRIGVSSPNIPPVSLKEKVQPCT